MDSYDEITPNGTAEAVEEAGSAEPIDADPPAAENAAATPPPAVVPVPLSSADVKPVTPLEPFDPKDFQRFTLEPSGAWPPPIYFDANNASREERFYMEYRWHAQWSYYDKKASEARRVYHRLQLVIGIGSVTVPVLVGVGPTFGDQGNTIASLFAIVISLCVTVAAAIENVKSYGETWRTMRSAAEELAREKALYDVKAGSYRASKYPFQLFTERCEEIMNRQNGAWAALKEEQNAALAQQAEEAMQQFNGGSNGANGTALNGNGNGNGNGAALNMP